MLCAYIILLRSVFEHATTDYGNHKYRVTFFSIFFFFFPPVKLVDHYLRSGMLKILSVHLSTLYCTPRRSRAQVPLDVITLGFRSYYFMVFVSSIFFRTRHRCVVKIFYHYRPLSALNVSTLVFSRKPFVHYRSIIVFTGLWKIGLDFANNFIRYRSEIRLRFLIFL